ncbi:hypothetical protein B0F90DRAFT_1160055 [Multifurca ochricompacta]|uniref:Uncharacterized protein n=1 Tax=Multifurca ochricompacta TaxID=376703 RepID=A0AAD4M8S5_9AGAM|nr:hypothetical protein B0F90DRAFT_1160055 [Multifurca ochricompacta]
MVSPTPTTSQPPVLSYAESARKAHGVKPTSQHNQKPLSNTPRQPPVPVPEQKKPGKSSPTVETVQISLADLSLRDTSTCGSNRPLLTSAGEPTTHTSSTREIVTRDTPSIGTVLPLLPSQPVPTKAVPVPNVWNQRIQQRSQARSQPRPSQSLPQSTPPHVPHASPPARDLPPAPSGSRQSDVLVSTSAQPTQNPSPSGLNGMSSTSCPSTRTTPSSRREPLPSPRAHSTVDDAENWPEVAKSQISADKSQHISNGHAVLAEAKDVAEKDTDGPFPSHPGTPRKSEKTKWIVIPPEDLQATADALNPARPYSQSRSHSQFSARNSQTQTRSTTASVSGSIQGSQAPSKVPSGRTSASHSRAHSPTSMTSSPQHLGRGRQLPMDVRNAQSLEQQQRSSQAEISMAMAIHLVNQQAPSLTSHHPCPHRLHLITLLRCK